MADPLDLLGTLVLDIHLCRRDVQSLNAHRHVKQFLMRKREEREALRLQIERLQRDSDRAAKQA